MVDPGLSRLRRVGLGIRVAAGHEFGIRPFGTQAEKVLMDAEAADVEVV